MYHSYRLQRVTAIPRELSEMLTGLWFATLLEASVSAKRTSWVSDATAVRQDRTDLDQRVALVSEAKRNATQAKYKRSGSYATKLCTVFEYMTQWERSRKMIQLDVISEQYSAYSFWEIMQ